VLYNLLLTRLTFEIFPVSITKTRSNSFFMKLCRYLLPEPNVITTNNDPCLYASKKMSGFSLLLYLYVVCIDPVKFHCWALSVTRESSLEPGLKEPECRTLLQWHLLASEDSSQQSYVEALSVMRSNITGATLIGSIHTIF
jgi:hypothetical protein